MNPLSSERQTAGTDRKVQVGRGGRRCRNALDVNPIQIDACRKNAEDEKVDMEKFEDIASVWQSASASRFCSLPCQFKGCLDLARPPIARSKQVQSSRSDTARLYRRCFSPPNPIPRLCRCNQDLGTCRDEAKPRVVPNFLPQMNVLWPGSCSTGQPLPQPLSPTVNRS